MTWLLLALLGGVVALDGVSLAQTMVSRPLVAGALAGLVTGDLAAGLQVGALLELFLLVAVPAGGGRMPEGGVAAVVAVATATASPGPGGLALGVAAGLLWGELASRTQAAVRRWNGVHAPLPEDGPVAASAVNRSIALGLGAEAARGAVVTGLGALTMTALSRPLAASWPLEEGITVALLLFGGLVSVGVVLRGRGLDSRASFLFLAGVIAATVAGWPR